MKQNFRKKKKTKCGIFKILLYFVKKMLFLQFFHIPSNICNHLEKMETLTVTFSTNFPAKKINKQKIHCIYFRSAN